MSIAQKIETTVDELLTEKKQLTDQNSRLKKELETLQSLYTDRLKGDLASFELQTLHKIDGSKLSEFPQGYHDRLILLTEVINHSARAYKHVQHFEGKIVTKIHNEYQYLARALAGLYTNTLKKEFEIDFNLALHDALCSACHILNDCVDMLTSYARGIRRELKTKHIYAVIHEADPKDAERITLLRHFEEITAESRYLRGYKRIQLYIQQVNSDEFKNLISYCKELEGISQNMHAAHNKVYLTLANSFSIEAFKAEILARESELKRNFDASQAVLKQEFDDSLQKKIRSNSTKNILLNGMFIFLSAFFTYLAVESRMNHKNDVATNTPVAPAPVHQQPIVKIPSMTH